MKKYIIIAVLIVVAGLAYYMFKPISFDCCHGEQYNLLDQPITSLPVIESITPSSGPIGTIVELKGKNFSNSGNDNNVWIENPFHSVGFLSIINKHSSSDQIIKVKIESPICKYNNKNPDKPCNYTMVLFPTPYKIYIGSPGKESNIVNFSLTN